MVLPLTQRQVLTVAQKLPCDLPPHFTSSTLPTTADQLTVSPRWPTYCTLDKADRSHVNTWHWLFILLEGVLYWSVWLNPLPPPSLCSISPWQWGLPWLIMLQVAILLIPYLDLLQKTNKWKYCIAIFTVWCRSWQPFPMKGQIIFYALWATQSVSW